jgi:hypothetical protein
VCDFFFRFFLDFFPCFLYFSLSLLLILLMHTDKHGLVNRFSRVLEENEINHMYSSTFKTANLLVDKRDALRAQALLRTC